MAVIRPYEDGFIGISNELLNWEQAKELAGLTGSQILAIEEESVGSRSKLLAWLGRAHDRFFLG
jgi:hypothetical protein